MTEPTQPMLKLIPGDRSALEEEIRRLVWTGTNEELHAAVEKLVRRAKLRAVDPEKRRDQ